MNDSLFCPVCGYTPFAAFEVDGSATHGICDSCGMEAGYEYGTGCNDERYQYLRNQWVLKENCKWHGMRKDLINQWSPYKQMKKVGMKYPLIPTLMAFFNLGLIDDEYAKNWADQNMESNLDDIDALIIISMYGMPRGIKLHGYEFP